MPRLETELDRDRELVVLEVLKERFAGATFERFSNDKFSPLDWMVCDESQILAVIEMKNRANPSNAFSDIFLAERKYGHLLQAAENAKYALFVAGFTDGKVLGIDVRKIDPSWKTSMARTKARASGLRGANDQENGYGVKIPNMKLIGMMTPDQLAKYTGSPIKIPTIKSNKINNKFSEFLTFDKE